MNQARIYKRDGYEFQVVEQCGLVSRAIGRKGKQVIHDVIMKMGNGLEGRWTFATETQASEKFNAIT